MITRIEAHRYRCLRSITQSLGPLEILVGPNASGKSAFLDVLRFLSTLVAEGLDPAIAERSQDFYDLVWGRHGNGFELAIEADVPPDKRHVQGGGWTQDKLRYEVELRIDPTTDTASFASESLVLSVSGFGRDRLEIIRRDLNQVLVYDPNSDALAPTGVARDQAQLRHMPRDEMRLPAVVWLTDLLSERIRFVALDPKELRKPSPPFPARLRSLEGSHLARFVAQLADHPERFRQWIGHLRTALPDLETIRTALRSEDRKRCLIIKYRNGVEVPSWVVSDGTLRLLALTVLAYLPGFDGVYLIEEPENGVHPTAVETFYQSLSSVYHGQVLVTTHSPVLLGMAKPNELLCFVGSEEGAAVVRGSDHPALREWQGDVSLSDLFASGTLAGTLGSSRNARTSCAHS